MVFNRFYFFLVFCFLAVSFSLQGLCAGGNEEEGKQTHVWKTYKRTLSGSIKETIRRHSYDESDDDDDFLEAVIEFEESDLRSSPYLSPPLSAGSDDSCVIHPAKKQKLSDSSLVNSDDDDDDFLEAVIEFEESYLRSSPYLSPPLSAGGGSCRISSEKKQKLSDSALVNSDDDDDDFLEAVIEFEESDLRSSPYLSSALSTDSGDSCGTSPEKKQELSNSVLVGSDDDDDAAFLEAAIEFEESHLRSSLYLSPPLSVDSDDRCAINPYDYDDGFNFQHLVTSQEHQDFMIGAINRAKKSVLITSYKFTADIRRGTALCKAIENANKRGVKIYLYADTVASIPSINDLSKLKNVKIEEATFHAKLLVVDSKEIACGSYDWLADPWRGVSQNASIVLEGDNLQPVVERLWEVLKKYRTLDSGCLLKGMQRWFENLPPLEYPLETDGDCFFILNTPYQHGQFFSTCFQQARKQVTICVPFISGYDGFLESIMPPGILIDFLRSGKKLYLFYNPKYEKNRLREYLDPILSRRYKYLRKNINLRAVDGLHRKTLFVDSDQYIEGSYNWLLSAREIEDDCAKMEVSIGFAGDEASRLIEKFHREVH